MHAYQPISQLDCVPTIHTPNTRCLLNLPVCLQVQAVNTSDHLFPGRPTSESYASWHNGCCTANNGQAWPKLAQRVVFTTPSDRGVAVGVFAPVRARLSSESTVLVDTDYPATDVVAVLLTRRAGDRARRTPMRVRVPGWATRATAWFNGQQVPARNGTMLNASCAPGLSLCNLTLKLSPRVRLESWFDNSVSVFRGPLVSIDIY